MIELAVNNLSVQFGETTLFEKITFDIKTGERVGLIGANGSGKSTLMRVIMGQENASRGDVFLRKGITIGYLDQMPDFDETTLVQDVIRLAFAPLIELKEQLSRLEERMEHESLNRSNLIKHYGEMSHRFEVQGGYMMETEFSKIVIGLNISENMLQQPFSLLSGGEKTRIVLAKILLEKPDILLLDEPSNHLDIKSIEWLEAYLANYKGAILIISHDRYFLDRSVNRIIELTYDEAVVYHGNYTYFTVEKERRFLLEMKYYEQQQKKIKRMEDQIKRYRIWGEMRDSDKMYVRAKELEKRLEKMEKVKKPVYETRKIKLDLSMQERTGNQVITCDDVVKAFGDKKILAGAQCNINFGDFACLLGENGSGKTTLFRLIMHELELDSGLIKIGSRVKIGYLPQQINYPDENMSVLEYFQYEHEIGISEARKELAKALFIKDDVFKTLKVLSGGEKSRLKLASLLYDHVNVLLLDEPTNHLDIESREVLEENLLEFDGTILFISHDRYFVDKLSSKILALEKGLILTYPFGYEDYKLQTSAEYKRDLQQPENTLNEIQLTKVTVEKTTLESSTNPKADTKVLSKNQEKRRIELEEAIDVLENELANKEAALVHIGDDHEKLMEAISNIESGKDKLSKLYEEWGKITM